MYFNSFHSFVLAGNVAMYLAGVMSTDVIYLVLPLYHSSAGMLSLGPSFLNGASITLRSKFSATKFWSDCVRYNCTVRTYWFVCCIFTILVQGFGILIIKNGLLSALGYHRICYRLLPVLDSMRSA